MTLFSDVGQVQMKLERKKEKPHKHSSLWISVLFTTVRNFSKLTLWIRVCVYLSNTTVVLFCVIYCKHNGDDKPYD